MRNFLACRMGTIYTLEKSKGQHCCHFVHSLIMTMLGLHVILHKLMLFSNKHIKIWLIHRTSMLIYVYKRLLTLNACIFNEAVFLPNYIQHCSIWGVIICVGPSNRFCISPVGPRGICYLNKTNCIDVLCCLRQNFLHTGFWLKCPRCGAQPIGPWHNDVGS